MISAKDGGIPFLAANLTLVVDVQDVNDNPPVFEHDSYEANVLESEPINFKVILTTFIISKRRIVANFGANWLAKLDYKTYL